MSAPEETGSERGVIRRDEHTQQPVVLDHWERDEEIDNGRTVRHIPSGCVFAVTWEIDGYVARQVDGPEIPEAMEIGRMGIGYSQLIGHASSPTFRRSRNRSPT